MGGSARVDDGAVATVADFAAVVAALSTAYLLQELGDQLPDSLVEGRRPSDDVALVAVRQDGARA